MMFSMKLLESILTYLLTAGALATITALARLARRVTILEEHDKEQVKAVDKISELSTSLTRIDTKLDLILEGRIK